MVCLTIVLPAAEWSRIAQEAGLKPDILPKVQGITIKKEVR
jgi:hypothetical protein